MKNVAFAKGTFLSRKERSFRYIVIPLSHGVTRQRRSLSLVNNAVTSPTLYKAEAEAEVYYLVSLLIDFTLSNRLDRLSFCLSIDCLSVGLSVFLY